MGIVQLKEIYGLNYDVKVAKFKVSENYKQAFINGSGIDFVENDIKSNTDSQYLIDEKIKIKQ